jgi:hypothetical protein
VLDKNLQPTKTEHSKDIPIIYPKILQLTEFIPDKKLRHPVRFAYRIVTYENLHEKEKEYDCFRLIAQYQDSMNTVHVITNEYKSGESIFEGEFPNGGSDDIVSIPYSGGALS